MNEWTDTCTALAATLQPPQSMHAVGAARPRTRELHRDICRQTNNDNPTKVFPERHSIDCLTLGASPWGWDAWASAHMWIHTTLPLSSLWNAPLDSMCYKEAPVSTGQTYGTGPGKV